MSGSINAIGTSYGNGDQRLDVPERISSTQADVQGFVQQQKVDESQAGQARISREQLLEGLEKAIQAFNVQYTYLEFSIHEDTKRIAVKVHDRETGEVIREIPPEKMLDIAAKLLEMAGILVDERR